MVALELDPSDVADRDPGHTDLVALLESADLGELGLVGVAGSDDRQAVCPERGEQHQRDGDEADEAYHRQVAFAEGLHG